MRFLIPVLLSFFISPAMAGFSPYSPTALNSAGTEETGYVGLVWSLGAGMNQTPEVSLGFQSVDTESDGDVDSGLDVNLRFAFNGINLPEAYSVRASSLFGDADGIGSVGIGLTNDGNWLVTAGFQVDYGRLRVDASFDGLVFTGELLSLELPDSSNATLICDGPQPGAPYELLINEDGLCEAFYDGPPT